jgi:hypothetical protein
MCVVFERHMKCWSWCYLSCQCRPFIVATLTHGLFRRPVVLSEPISNVATMRERLDLLSGSVLRGFQMLFFVVVLGLSVTLVKHYGDGWEQQDQQRPSAPWTLSVATGIGALSLVAAVFSLVITWTNLLREYIKIVVDRIVVVVNVVGGVTSI